MFFLLMQYLITIHGEWWHNTNLNKDYLCWLMPVIQFIETNKIFCLYIYSIQNLDNEHTLLMYLLLGELSRYLHIRSFLFFARLGKKITSLKMLMNVPKRALTNQNTFHKWLTYAEMEYFGLCIRDFLNNKVFIW